MSLIVNIEKNLGSFCLKANFETDSLPTAMLGASGCGKSLTLRCIAGIVKPDKGRIVLNGRVLFDSEKGIDLPPQQRRIGYLFQNYALFPNMTVEQNIACGLCNEKDKSAKKEKIAQIIKQMQLDTMEKRKPHQLSGGQQQRVALARILVGEPEILLLDEPFSALDSYLRDQMLAEVKRILANFSKDLLLVTHNRDEAYSMCPQIMIMNNGRIIRKGNTKEVFACPRNIASAVLTGCKNIYKAEKYSQTAVYVPDLDAVFEAGQVIEDDVCAIGIRAHYFNPKTKTNLYNVALDEEIENPFEWTIKFRYENQKHHTQSVWWRIPKDKKLQQFPTQLGFAPANLHVLYPEEKEL